MSASVTAVSIKDTVNTEPLRFGNSWTFGGKVLGEVEGRQAVSLAYKHGEPYEFRFNISNNGEHEVTILSLGPLTAGLLANVDLRMGPPPDRFGQHISPFKESYIPFAPFTLKPDEQRAVQVVTRFAGCESFGAGTGFSRIPVKFKMLGLERTQQFPLADVSINPPPPLRDVYVRQAPRPGCPAFVAIGDELNEGEGAIEPYSGNLRVSVSTKPRYEITLVNTDARDVTSCRLVVNENSSGGYSAFVPSVQGEDHGPFFGPKIVAVGARSFVSSSGKSWSPKSEPIETLRVTCEGNHHGGAIDEPSDLLNFVDEN